MLTDRQSSIHKAEVAYHAVIDQRLTEWKPAPKSSTCSMSFSEFCNEKNSDQVLHWHAPAPSASRSLGGCQVEGLSPRLRSKLLRLLIAPICKRRPGLVTYQVQRISIRNYARTVFIETLQTAGVTAAAAPVARNPGSLMLKRLRLRLPLETMCSIRRRWYCQQ
jgi:hypothetical protein